MATKRRTATECPPTRHGMLVLIPTRHGLHGGPLVRRPCRTQAVDAP